MLTTLVTWTTHIIEDTTLLDYSSRLHVQLVTEIVQTTDFQ